MAAAAAAAAGATSFAALLAHGLMELTKFMNLSLVSCLLRVSVHRRRQFRDALV